MESLGTLLSEKDLTTLEEQYLLQKEVNRMPETAKSNEQAKSMCIRLDHPFRVTWSQLCLCCLANSYGVLPNIHS